MKDKYRLSKEENIKLVKDNLVKLIYNSAKLEELNVALFETGAILEGVNVRSIKLMLYCMRAQLFWNGNKRTSMIKEEDILEFNKLLSEYYTTSNSLKSAKFIYERCIFGIEN